jgi:hypothetical protein
MSLDWGGMLNLVPGVSLEYVKKAIKYRPLREKLD